MEPKADENEVRSSHMTELSLSSRWTSEGLPVVGVSVVGLELVPSISRCLGPPMWRIRQLGAYGGGVNQSLLLFHTEADSQSVSL